MGFAAPSKIQGLAIPVILKYVNFVLALTSFYLCLS
jgi:hypothetical protein